MKRQRNEETTYEGKYVNIMHPSSRSDSTRHLVEMQSIETVISLLAHSLDYSTQDRNGFLRIEHQHMHYEGYPFFSLSFQVHIVVDGTLSDSDSDAFGELKNNVFSETLTSLETSAQHKAQHSRPSTHPYRHYPLQTRMGNLERMRKNIELKMASRRLYKSSEPRIDPSSRILNFIRVHRLGDDPTVAESYVLEFALIGTSESLFSIRDLRDVVTYLRSRIDTLKPMTAIARLYAMPDERYQLE